MVPHIVAEDTDLLVILKKGFHLSRVALHLLAQHIRFVFVVQAVFGEIWRLEEIIWLLVVEFLSIQNESNTIYSV